MTQVEFLVQTVAEMMQGGFFKKSKHSRADAIVKMKKALKKRTLQHGYLAKSCLNYK